MYENFRNIAAMTERAIAADMFAGANIAVIHGGETVFSESFGMADREKGIKMSQDSIFRLFSLTKPITAAAAMLLLERGEIELAYPIKWFLPTFENPTVLDENGERPAKRDITIGDLLSMTSGITYPDATPAGMKMGELWGKRTYDYEQGKELCSTRDFVMQMGSCPLAFSPGEGWLYGASADVMGAVIETVSGRTFGEFLQQEIFEPLSMCDTGFFVPPEKAHRLAQAYDRTEKGNIPLSWYNLCTTDFKAPPAFESGGAGLVSTIGDYGRFVKMLLGKGSTDGVRILGRKTAELMTRNFLPAGIMSSIGWDSMRGHGYGCFMRVLCDRTASGSNGTEGEYGWDGWLGCYFSADPSEQLAMLYFIQQTNSGCTDFTRKLKNVIWGAL